MRLDDKMVLFLDAYLSEKAFLALKPKILEYVRASANTVKRFHFKQLSFTPLILRSRFTPLEELIVQGNLTVIQYFIEQGADPKYINPETGRSALEFAQERKKFFDQEWPYNYSEEKDVLDKIIVYLSEC